MQEIDAEVGYNNVRTIIDADIVGYRHDDEPLIREYCMKPYFQLQR